MILRICPAALLFCLSPVLGTGADELSPAQQDALLRVDSLSAEFLAMDSQATSVRALAHLGDVSCRYDKARGESILLSAYRRLIGSDKDELSPRSRARLYPFVATRLSSCSEELADRIEAEFHGQDDSFDLSKSLDAARAGVSVDPTVAARLMGGVADRVSLLSDRQARTFVGVINDLRPTASAAADELFARALDQAIGTASVGAVFALGNYVLGPANQAGGGIVVMPLPGGGTAYVLNTVRPEAADELLPRYLNAASAVLAAPASQSGDPSMRYLLGAQVSQLSSGIEPMYPGQLEFALQSAADELHRLGELGSMSQRLVSTTGDYYARLEDRLDNAKYLKRRSEVLLHLFAYRILDQDFEAARSLIDRLPAHDRGPFDDIVTFKQAIAGLATSAEIEAATAVSPSSGLHRALFDLEVRSLSQRTETGLGRPLDARPPSIAIDTLPARLRAPLVIMQAQADLNGGAEPRDAYTAGLQAVLDLNVGHDEKPIDDRGERSSTLDFTANGFIQILRAGVTTRVFRLVAPHAPKPSLPELVAALAAAGIRSDELIALVDPLIDEHLRATCMASTMEGDLRAAFSGASAVANR